MLDYALEALVAALLAATVVHCTLLHRKLARLRGDQEQLGKLIADFAAATERAEASIAALKNAGEEAGTGLQASVARAVTLRDDLEFLGKQGTRLADRLEALLAEGRSIVRPGADLAPLGGHDAPQAAAETHEQRLRLRAGEEGPGAEGGASDLRRDLPRSRAEQDLLRALRSMKG